MADSQSSINFAGAMVGVGMVAILGFVVWALAWHDIPQANAQLFSTALGIVGIQVGYVTGYFYGSSANNKKLAETNATQAQTIATAQAALSPTNTVTLNPGEATTVAAKENP